MYTQSTISEFSCEYCHQKFLVADYNNDVDATREATRRHEKECRAKIKLCLGDVLIFNIPSEHLHSQVFNTQISPPMKITWVNIKDEANKELHVVLAKYNYILGVWEEDQKAMKWYKDNYNIDYFTMYQNQINKQISLKNFKQSHKIVKVLADWIEETSQHYQKQCETNIGYDYENNNILLTIKIPYKTKGRIKK